MLDAYLLEGWDLASSLPVRQRGLAHADGFCSRELRAEVLDELIKFHVVVCSDVGYRSGEYKRCDSTPTSGW